jgi:very-short-patch-repair endonuclease
VGPPAISRVTALAARQHGVVSSKQLHAAGWTPAQVKTSVRAGWLTAIHRGVYAVGSPVLSIRGRLAAAVLACGAAAVVSHRSAAVLWQLLEWVDRPVDITVAGRNVRTRTGILVHRVGRLRLQDQRQRHGLPVTSPSLTVLDLAATEPDAAEEAWNEALLRRLSSEEEMAALLAVLGSRPGARVMRRILAASGGDFSRQAAEKALRALIRDAGLPKPRRNVGVHGHELDFFWPELRLNVEMDGYRWHSTRARLNRDRRRDAELTARGIKVLRISYDQLEEPRRLVAQLAAAIALASVST